VSEVVRVAVGETTYPVHVGAGALAGAGALVAERLEADRAVVIADRRVDELHGRALRRSLRGGGVKPAAWLTIPPGERSKSLASARRLYDALIEAGVDRWTPVIALGGGVAGDLAGYVASTFLRGMPLVQIPTTVVAQVDSAVGGKTAVNHAGTKNLIGTFHQPSLVVADPDLLATLTPRDYRAGLAEVVKIAVTLRPDLMERLEAEESALAERSPELLTAAVRACVEAKAEVVSRDERDRDVRSILNYGHTVGHALEAEARGRLRHGEAVAVGMNAAAWVGETIGVTPPEVRRRQNALLERIGLRLSVSGADKRVIARKLKLDKKVRSQRTRFVLTLQMGGASVWPHIPGKILRRAVDQVVF
jgi:3-dehydroquinate synthase